MSKKIIDLIWFSSDYFLQKKEVEYTMLLTKHYLLCIISYIILIAYWYIIYSAIASYHTKIDIKNCYFRLGKIKVLVRDIKIDRFCRRDQNEHGYENLAFVSKLKQIFWSSKFYQGSNALLCLVPNGFPIPPGIKLLFKYWLYGL